jgi:PAS domain-containing protein
VFVTMSLPCHFLTCTTFFFSLHCSDRHQLVQQMQIIGGGTHGPQAASAVRHVAAQNGVWSLGNFGGVPPKSAMTLANQGSVTADQTTSQPEDAMQPSKVEPHEYRFVFNSCGVGMAIASMGGAFIECNQLFCQLSDFTKQEVCALTIFNMTARQDLQQAFDLISQMISPPMDSRTQEEPDKPIVLRGAMKNRVDLGLSVSLVKGEDGISKCFCVTLVKNPASPFDTSKPVPVSFEAVGQKSVTTVGDVANVSKKNTDGMNHTPAFTSG